MNYKKAYSSLIRIPLIAIILGGLAGCGGSDSDGNVGYIQLYNASSNSPNIYLTVDQYDDDDFNEKTHSGIAYSGVSSRFEYDTDTYDIELAWQDEYNGTNDLEVVYGNSLKIRNDIVSFMVIAEDIKTPNVFVYEIPLRDDNERDDDYDDELFNLRFLDMHAESNNIDIYLSKSDETINEAVLIAQSSYAEMSDNRKLKQDDYVFYISTSGNREVLYQSNEISFQYASEYILVVRKNQGAGSSPYIIDVVSATTSTEFPHANSEVELKVYNGITEHELLPNYQGVFDFYIGAVDDSAEIPSLAFGQMSDTIQFDFGDYSINLQTPNSSETIIENHLLSLNENSNKTVFFYLVEDDVDEDGDGDVDEDGDGYVDEIEITLNSLVVDNSQSEGIYNHKISIVNLIDDDDFTFVDVYFVLSDEIIATADNLIMVPYVNPKTINLLNNTYSVYVIGNDGTSDIVFNTFELILNESSKDQFLILEKDIYATTGYKVTLTDQND
jgi:hypothetical protein